jgi:hypothetical protein
MSQHNSAYGGGGGGGWFERGNNLHGPRGAFWGWGWRHRHMHRLETNKVLHLKLANLSMVPVAHTYNPSYLGG